MTTPKKKSVVYTPLSSASQAADNVAEILMGDKLAGEKYIDVRLLLRECADQLMAVREEFRRSGADDPCLQWDFDLKKCVELDPDEIFKEGTGARYYGKKRPGVLLTTLETAIIALKKTSVMFKGTNTPGWDYINACEFLEFVAWQLDSARSEARREHVDEPCLYEWKGLVACLVEYDVDKVKARYAELAKARELEKKQEKNQESQQENQEENQEGKQDE